MSIYPNRDLREAIASALKEEPGIEAVPTLEEDLPAPDSSVALDFSYTLQRLGGDKQLLQEIVQIFLEETPAQMTQLRAAVLAQNPPALEKAAHRLKGELGYLGLCEVSSLAFKLEDLGRKRALQSADKVLLAFEKQISKVLDLMREMNSGQLSSPSPQTANVGAFPRPSAMASSQSKA